ncbi:MAG: hypothetical protein PHC84_05965, partial [Clostridia bacterium]|nr:hypothetical protein [Clostridia bacterium]
MAVGFTMEPRDGRKGYYPQLTAFFGTQLSAESAEVNYFHDGEDIVASPYMLADALDLVNMQRLVGAYFSEYGSSHYKMLNDIILEEDFEPIASFDNPFLGTLEGDYYSIYNLSINKPDANFVGLFSAIGTGARVKELNIRPYIVSPTEIYGGIVGDNYVGAIAGHSIGDIWDCMNNTDVSGDSYIGGIAGYAKNISRSCNTATVTGMHFVGGMAGEARGSIQSSFNSGYIIGDGSHVGGISGANFDNSIIEVCYNSGNIESHKLGEAYQGDLKGGISGYNSPGSIVRNCYNIGGIKGEAGYAAGGIIGMNDSTEVTLSYFNNEVLSGFSAVGTGTAAGATVSGLTTVQMVGADALNYMVFTSGHYVSNEERGMDADFAPQLLVFYNILAEPGENADIISEIKNYSKQSVMLRLLGRDVYNIFEWGSKNNPYRIETFDHLDTLSKQVLNGYSFSNCYFEVTADIEIQGGFLPIGRFDLASAIDSLVFRGNFDGKGFLISNLVVGDSETIYSQGLFGYIGENAVVKNVIIASGDIVGSERVGSVVGYSRGKVDRCYSAASVLGANNVGGIVGMLLSNTVTNSLYVGEVLGNSNWGGIVGFFENTYASVQNCWYAKDINAADSHNKIGSVLYIDQNGTINSYIDTFAADEKFIYFEFLPYAGFDFEMRNIDEDTIVFDAGGIVDNVYYPMYNAQTAQGAQNWYARFTKAVTIAELSNATASGSGNYYEGQQVIITVEPEKGYGLVLDYGTYDEYSGDGDYIDCMRTMGDVSWEFTASIVAFGDGPTEIINPDGIKATVDSDSFDYDGQPKLYSINIPGFVAYTEYYRTNPRTSVDEPINAMQYQLIIKLQEGSVIVGSKLINYVITPLKLALDLEELALAAYSTKQYDKYSYDEIDIGAAAIIGVVDGDEVLLTAVRKYFNASSQLDPNIGNDKFITFEEFNISGTGKSNYSVPDTLTDIPGSIIKRDALINILSDNLSKQYDGNAPIIVAHSFEGDLGDGLFVNEFSFTRIGEPSAGMWDAGEYTIGLTENISGNKENYNIILNESYVFVILKKVISNVTFNGYQSLQYSGSSQHTAIVARYPLTANTFGYAELVYYHNNQPIPDEEVLNAGDYIAKAVIAAEDVHNFELDGEKSVSFTIARINQPTPLVLADIADNTYQLKQVDFAVSGGDGPSGISFEVLQGSANVIADTLYINGAGAISVRAVKAESTNYFSQNSNTVTFNISKGVLTAAVSDVCVSYGDAPDIRIEYQGLLRGETHTSEIAGLIEPEIYVIGQNLIVNEDDGYEIRLRDNGNADGYIIDISNVSARLFVMRKQLHIMADSVSKRYG